MTTPPRRDPWDLPDVEGVSLAVLGGTGPLGRGLARRFALAGHQVVLGSRDAARAQEAADALRADSGRDDLPVRGAGNADAAQGADVVVVAVPWDAHEATLADLVDALDGTVVVDAVNPLGFDEGGAFPLVVEDGSAAQQAARLLPGSRVVGAFHHLSAVTLLDAEVESLDCDVMVVGDDREATDLVQALCGRLPGARGVYVGKLRTAASVEGLTANLISSNRRYKAHAGLRVTDV